MSKSDEQPDRTFGDPIPDKKTMWYERNTKSEKQTVLFVKMLIR